MNQVLQSPVFHSLGYSIINSLWQYAALWLLYFLFANSLYLKANTKFILAVFLKLIGFVLFISTFLLHFNTIEESIFNSTLFSLVNSTSFNSVLKQVESYLPYLSIIYLLFVLTFIAKWVVSFFEMQELRSIGISKIPVEWSIFTRKISLHLGIQKEIKIYLSSLIKSPLTIGYLKPIILIPLANLNQLTVEQLEAVIIHELAHIKRSDYLINVLFSIIDVLLFFNPFNTLLSKSLEQEREHDCDDWVLQFKYNHIIYAEALLNLATLKSKKLSLSLANKNGLLNRIKRISGLPIKSISFFQKFVAALLVMIVVFSFSFLSAKINSKFKSKQRATILKNENESIINSNSIVYRTNKKVASKSSIVHNAKLRVSKSSKEKTKTRKENVDLFISKYNDVLSFQNYILEQKELKEKLNEYKTVFTNKLITKPTIDSLQKELIEVVLKVPTLTTDSVKSRRRIIIL